MEKKKIYYDKKKGCLVAPKAGWSRMKESFCIRLMSAAAHLITPPIDHPCNGDEERYPAKIGNYSKGLPHNSLGEADIPAYNSYIQALKTGNPEDFESIPIGGTVKLSNPQAAYAYDLTGQDCQQLDMPVPPAFSSAWQAGEMAELYWQALTRDIPFQEYGTNPLIQEAAEELSGFSDFRGPKANGKVTPATLFRSEFAGNLTGPYISQFLWKDIPCGATTITQRYRTTLPGADYLTSYDKWLAIQNGAPSSPSQTDPISRYIRNGRDLGEYVHYDFSFQCPLSACLILLGYGREALDPNNPYHKSATQGGFVTFGAAHILDMVTRAGRLALEVAWFQKFLIHRRLRPEEFGGRVHNQLSGSAGYPIHPELLKSKAISHVFSKYGTYLLPIAYPEGCPTHPAYPAGHACIAGAGITILKAFFNEAFIIPDPVEASSDGLSLLPYSDHPLTVGGELNKLAVNISLGRDTAGVHWRSDGIEGLKLGEEAAIGLLRDYRATYNEKFSGFTLTKFNGKKIKIK
ncbi:vanadium-dependent haloperoxidase [Bacillus sp. J33]|uniref:vanadium-dependent haloperoxidase n=1 Tax=Bacillus sp. J33 TaxID=935836 RepID=UPI00047E7A33|nr:vanadium-dependent haloperoxidase [Bacillus sp. J33]